MEFTRSSDEVPQLQFQNAATSASAFANPSPNGSTDSQLPHAQRADDPQVLNLRPNLIRDQSLTVV